MVPQRAAITRKQFLESLSWVASLLAAASAGCSSNETRRPFTSEVFHIDSGVTLEVRVARDTIEAGKTVQLWVVLANGGEPTEINNHPDRLRVEVETQAGKQVDPVEASSIDVFLGPQTGLVLPHRAVFAQLLTLDCVSDGYTRREGGCYYRYRFPGPGAYRIITTFRGWTKSVLVDTAAVFVRPSR